MNTVKYNTLNYLISALKTYQIYDIVASPGTQNARFNSLVQENLDFKTYSVIDERSAAYVATGIWHEINNPVVITCTGATASRNYLSAMTECYYRKIPVIAITFYDPDTNRFGLSPQYVDRTSTQNDVKYLSVDLPMIDSNKNIEDCILNLNAALSRAKYLNQPVHINCPANQDYQSTNELPNVWHFNYYTELSEDLTRELGSKRVAIYIGSHHKFTKAEEEKISNFASSWNIPVFCDHTSNYKGSNKILLSQAFMMLRSFRHKPEIIIDIGNVSGEYTNGIIYKKAQVWRISPDGLMHCRNNKSISKLFHMKECYFFENLMNKKETSNDYYTYMNKQISQLKIPELPLCTSLVCQYLSKYLPKNSILHTSILNSLRNMNFFDLDSSIDFNCNVGGFGIDGGVSTLVGQSIANYNKKCFGLIGDLAFFYDMNILGNKHISKNLKILVINNNCGVEFRLNNALEKHFGNKTNRLISAGEHNLGGVKGWVESCGFAYIQANQKEDFINKIKHFCNDEFDKPVVFEVFTEVKDEQNGIYNIRTFNRNKIEEGLINCYKGIKQIIK